jgi:preprotein translocase subunit SecD
MGHFAYVLAALILGGSYILPASAQDKSSASPKKLPAGVYVVLREKRSEKEVLPLKDGEALVVNRHRYVKKEDREPPHFVVVRCSPDVEMDLAEKPKAVKEGEEVVRILLKLKPKSATDLERVTADSRGKQIAIVLDGEVVTIHKIRQVIKGGEVQISSCAAGGAKYLLEQLQAHPAKK